MLRAIFLDREGVLTPKLKEGEYLLRDDQVVLAPHVAALKLLTDRGGRLFVVSNQSCVGRGLIAAADANQLHEKVLDRLASVGIVITDSRLCFHVDEDACLCRKPKAGMILDLARRYEIDLQNSAMIGDSARDVAAGQAAGCRLNVLLGDSAIANPSVLTVPDLFAAVELLSASNV